MEPTRTPPQDTKAVLHEALRRILKDESLTSFCDWFAASMFTAVQSQHPVAPAEQEEAARFQRHVARHLWGHLPVPSNRWRARGLPKVDRNGPCHCGSGRKFKQCCAVFDHAALPMPSESLLVLALEAAEPDMLTHDKMRLIPAMELGMAAMNWNDDGRPDKTVEVLAPLFTHPQTLDARHEPAMDALVDAMQRLGQDRTRRELLENMAQHRNKVLATAARCRLVSVLADQGEEAQAWQLFHETSRYNPNDPQLWHLELTLLLSQGRDEEARLRAPLLAARARQANLPELASAMMQMAEHGLDVVNEFSDGDIDDPEDLMWMDVCGMAPGAVDRPALLDLYAVNRSKAEHDSETVTTVSFRPTRALADLERQWRRRFPVGKPDITYFDGDVDALLDDLPGVLVFLKKHPRAWLSASILDDLLLVGAFLCDWESPRPLLKATRRVADHAVAVLRALVGDGQQLHWAEAANRPMLRSLGIAIELARYSHDTANVEGLLRLGLALNPNDNHGWRALLSPLWLEQQRYHEALALMDKYPNDFAPSEHLRVLALFCIGEKTEAERVLRDAHQNHPLVLNTLLPEALDPPPEEPSPGIRIGGATAAWHHRQDCRAMWLRTGALAWASALHLPEPAPPRQRKPPAKARAKAPSGRTLGIAALTKPVGEREEIKLRKTCSEFERLHGLLQAVAWSPQVLMPNAWLSKVMDLHDRMPNCRTEATAQKAHSDTLALTMRLYNHLNQRVLDHQTDALPLLGDVMKVVNVSEEATFAWAAGFVQGCELHLAAWGRHGHKVTGHTGPFGSLRALAARAPTRDRHEHVMQDDGKPLLLPLDDAPPPQQLLVRALTELWPVVVASREAMHRTQD